jgi:hypothetical protein
LERYNNQLNDKYIHIKNVYNNYFKILNDLFDVDIPKDIDLEKKVVLSVFGFDDDQKKGKLKNLKKIMDDNKYPYYFKGNTDLPPIL